MKSFYRKEQSIQIEKYLKSFCNLLIIGNAGTAKTSTVKHVLSKFSNHAYVDCLESATIFSILSKILKDSSIPIIRQAYSIDELVEKFSRLLERKGFIIALDNAEYIREKTKVLIIFSNLLKRHKFCLILIARNDFFRHIDKKLVASFVFVKVEFKSFTAVEIWDILKDNFEMNESLLAIIARESHGNINMAFDIAEKSPGNIGQLLKFLEELKI